ncbi:hypothetical protein DICVIV_01220 [Dictyocaulus viviparus]|uniref:Uncharacterized protein n=1 Tax=Dictyocaulus viviparus TaxID=29172 RepID=A0A0D8Y7C4_DICVI|nr:hypothetical protein DICVIV_01220 [Dictyocaulus viviparus]
MGRIRDEQYQNGEQGLNARQHTALLTEYAPPIRRKDIFQMIFFVLICDGTSIDRNEFRFSIDISLTLGIHLEIRGFMFDEKVIDGLSTTLG